MREKAITMLKSVLWGMLMSLPISVIIIVMVAVASQIVAFTSMGHFHARYFFTASYIFGGILMVFGVFGLSSSLSPTNSSMNSRSLDYNYHANFKLFQSVRKHEGLGASKFLYVGIGVLIIATVIEMLVGVILL